MHRPRRARPTRARSWSAPPSRRAARSSSSPTEALSGLLVLFRRAGRHRARIGRIAERRLPLLAPLIGRDVRSRDQRGDEVAPPHDAGAAGGPTSERRHRPEDHRSGKDDVAHARCRSIRRASTTLTWLPAHPWARRYGPRQACRGGDAPARWAGRVCRRDGLVGDGARRFRVPAMAHFAGRGRPCVGVAPRGDQGGVGAAAGSHGCRHRRPLPAARDAVGTVPQLPEEVGRKLWMLPANVASSTPTFVYPALTAISEECCARYAGGVGGRIDPGSEMRHVDFAMVSVRGAECAIFQVCSSQHCSAHVRAPRVLRAPPVQQDRQVRQVRPARLGPLARQVPLAPQGRPVRRGRPDPLVPRGRRTPITRALQLRP